jgi:hypothetical protein
MFPRTVVQYASPSRPLPRQHILFERPFWLFLRNLCLPVTHRWGSVGLSSHSSSVCVGTLALFAGDRRARALQGIVCSTTKRVRRPVLPPTLLSCGSLSKSFGPSLCPPLERLVLRLVVRFFYACPPKRVRRPLPRGVHRVCVASRCRVVYRFSFSQHSMLVVTLALAIVWVCRPLCFFSFTMPTSARVNAHHDSSPPPTCRTHPAICGRHQH